MKLSRGSEGSFPFKGKVGMGMGLLPAQTHPHPSPGVFAALRRSAGGERCSPKPLLRPLEGEGENQCSAWLSLVANQLDL